MPYRPKPSPGMRDRRLWLGLTIADLAEKCTCSVSTISRIERGLQNPIPSGGLRVRTAKELDISPEEIGSQRTSNVMRNARLDKGMWLKDLAELCGAHPSTISRIERGVHGASPHCAGSCPVIWKSLTTK